MVTVREPAWLQYLTTSCLFALGPAWWARRKGYDFLTWQVLGTLCFPLALVLAWRAPLGPFARRECSSCGADLAVGAAACATCGTPTEPTAAIAPVPHGYGPRRAWHELLAWLYHR